MLFLEFHGTEASVAEQSKRFGEIAAEYAGGPFTWTTRPEDRTRNSRTSKLKPDHTDVDWAKAPTAEEPGLRGATTAS